MVARDGYIDSALRLVISLSCARPEAIPVLSSNKISIVHKAAVWRFVEGPTRQQLQAHSVKKLVMPRIGYGLDQQNMRTVRSVRSNISRCTYWNIGLQSTLEELPENGRMLLFLSIIRINTYINSVVVLYTNLWNK